MWTKENRYDHSMLQYSSDLAHEERALIKPLIPAAKKGGNKHTVDARQVVGDITYCPQYGVPVGGPAEEPAAADVTEFPLLRKA